jgi:hypothetical protein
MYALVDKEDSCTLVLPGGQEGQSYTLVTKKGISTLWWTGTLVVHPGGQGGQLYALVDKEGSCTP